MTNNTLHQIEKYIQKNLSKNRLNHTYGVMNSAIELAILYDGDIESAKLAALLHDCAKHMSVEEMKKFLCARKIDLDFVEDNTPNLLHSKVGAILAREIFGIEDKDIINAVFYHTTGRVGMTKLEKIVCLADYIEIGRSFKGVDEIRKLSKKSMDEALLEGFNQTILSLIKKRALIHPVSIATRNDLIKNL